MAPERSHRLGGQVLADLIGLGAAGVEVVEFSTKGGPPRVRAGAVRVGVHRTGDLPTNGLEDFDVLLSADRAAPSPWVASLPGSLDRAVDELRLAVTAQPVAAAVAAQVVRMTLHLGFDDALALESLAYSMLLSSEGFRAWRAATPVRQRPDFAEARVRMTDEGGAISIRLNRPERRNAFDAAMRDALVEALTFALDHPDQPPVLLSGEGPAFSAGGDLDEFGEAPDPGAAHLIRTLRSPAKLAHQLGERLTARVHGACVGAGIEVPAAAARVTAAPETYFRLPEVSMGLIPGAGGTATIARRIGRHRAAYMAISGADIDLSTAIAWGLVDEQVGA